MLLLCLAIILAVVFIMAMRPSSSPEAVIADHAKIDLPELLKEVLAIDLDENYPETPEEVMRLFTHTFRILYGWDKSDVETISRVIEVQRGLYSQALADINSLSQQLSTLLTALDVQYERGLEIIGIYQSSPVFNRFSPDRCVVNIIKYANNNQSFHYNHHLFRHPESGRWQIGFWEEVE